MKVLVVGSGGREHALAWKIRRSPRLTRLFTAPGNAGTALVGENVLVSPDDLDGLLELASARRVDLTVVGPEAPLAAGIVDRFRQAGLRVAGPSAAAARLESSKAFAKDFMRRHGIPTAHSKQFTDASQAESFIREGVLGFPVVLKADGLAAGKGVFICITEGEALQALDAIMRRRSFGAAGDRLVVEEFLRGKEASFMVFTDGRQILPMVPSRDHKAIFEGDQGPNTGGMGAFSRDEILSEAQRQAILDKIIRPTVEGMAQEGVPFQGVLYAGLMLTASGPKVLEFNVRFGDPETQVILPRLESDLLSVFEALAAGDLSGLDLKWSPQATACVVLAAKGYPGSYETGKKVLGLELAEEDPATVVFHAGTRLDAEGFVRTSGGRVLAVSCSASDLGSAVLKAYEGVNKIFFEGMYCRRDIAASALSPDTGP